MDVRRRPVRTGRWADVGERGDWTLVLRINLDSTWQLSQEIGREMVARGSGKIVDIASLLSFSGGVPVPAYAASKHAIAGLTKGGWMAR